MKPDIVIATILWLVAATITIAVIAYLLQRLYRRSTKGVAFVRTGLGGQKVVIDGGALVLPIVHEVTPVNMSVLRMGIVRASEHALITRDRMRVDLEADFYVRVAPTADAVAAAAQALGGRTMEQEQLHELLTGKFVDALRSVAAAMSMEEMHERRSDYVSAVRAAAAGALAQNGLVLESVAITKLDQADLKCFNPSNRFDAEGLTQLTEQIEARRKLRNDVEQETAIQIRLRNLEAERRALEIDRESEVARLEQERDLEIRRAAQRAQLARERAQRAMEAEQAEIAAREVLEKTRIANERTLAETRIESERETQQREIERRRAIEGAEIAAREETEKARLMQERALNEVRIEGEQQVQRRELVRQRAIEEAQIATQQAIETARIANEKVLSGERISVDLELEKERIAAARLREELEIERGKRVALAEQEREIALAGKRIERVAADTKAQETEIAARMALEIAALDETIALHAKTETEQRASLATEHARMKAGEAAEQVATVRETEIAKRRAAVDTILAKRDADAVRIAAEAEKLRLAVQAEGQRQLNQAENLLSGEARAALLRRKLIDHLEGIVRESVRPIEKIEGIRILHVDGMAGTGNGARNPTDEVIDSALRYRVQAPMIDSLMREIGIEGGSVTRMIDPIRDAKDLQSVAKEGAQAKARRGDGGAAGG